MEVAPHSRNGSSTFSGCGHRRAAPGRLRRHGRQHWGASRLDRQPPQEADDDDAAASREITGAEGGLKTRPRYLRKGQRGEEEQEQKRKEEEQRQKEEKAHTRKEGKQKDKWFAGKNTCDETKYVGNGRRDDGRGGDMREK